MSRASLNLEFGVMDMKAFALVALMAASQAHGATLTSNYDRGVGNEGAGIRLEQRGYTYLTSSAYINPDALFNLHDDAGLKETEVKRTDGKQFSAKSAVYSFWNKVYRTALTPNPVYCLDECEEDASDEEITAWMFGSQPSFQNLGWYGYRGGELVASVVGFQDSIYPPKTISFGANFRNIDSLVIKYFLPDNYVELFGYPNPYGMEPGGAWCEEFCGELTVDSLTVSTVPIPAGGYLLLCAIGILSTVRTSARQKQPKGSVTRYLP